MMLTIELEMEVEAANWRMAATDSPQTASHYGLSDNRYNRNTHYDIEVPSKHHPKLLIEAVIRTTGPSVIEAESRTPSATLDIQ